MLTLLAILTLLPLLAPAQNTPPASETGGLTAVVNASDDINDGVCDSAHCSLREAIIAANESPGADTIAFNIPGAGPHTIQPTFPLPLVFDPVTIDGTTEPDYAGTPIVELDGSRAGDSFVSGLQISGGETTIRGLVINRFSFAGILFAAGGDNVAEGNYIGTDVTGTLAQGNRDGIYILGSHDNLIGGTTASARNVISGNHDDGVNPNTADGTIIQGNYIGMDVTGANPLPNQGDGIKINRTSNHTLVGGTTPGAGNIIAFNNGRGVFVEASPTPHVGNAFLGNAIFSNNGPAIALDGDGTPLQNPPALESAIVSHDSAAISGVLNSAPNEAFRVEFFANTRCSGDGEGERVVGYLDVTTDGEGRATFTARFEAGLLPGEGVSATATDASSSTSEFGACIEVVEAASKR